MIFGCSTPSGQRLKDMTGIAAILRFAINTDEQDESESVDSEEERIRAI